MVDNIKFINQIDKKNKTKLHYALDNPKSVYLLLEAGADPFKINPNDISNEKVLEIFKKHWTKILICIYQSNAFQEFYNELISKQKLLNSFYGKNEIKLIKQLNLGFKVVFDVSNANNWCRSCLKISDNLNRCSKCKVCFYCDKICQHRDWKNHKKICGILCKKKFNCY